MKSILFSYLMLCFAGVSLAQDTSIVLVIHGGAGNFRRKDISPEKERAYKEKLDEALNAGYDTLYKGGTSVTAIEIAIKILEDSPLFNAGKGAVLTNQGKAELDASIMDGKTLKAGAVAGVTTVKNPISAARAVMERSQHVLLVSHGAEVFAKECGLTIVPNKYFLIDKRKEQLKKAKEQEKKGNDTSTYIPEFNDYKFGTVGAVALDRYGNLAAATSTGGMANKRYGRVGDSPIIGAGTYADNNSAAISCTGHGEYFIRLSVAHEITALMKYKGYTLQEAADDLIHKRLKPMGAEGGLIGLDAKGNLTMTFNTSGMYRAYKKGNMKFVELF